MFPRPLSAVSVVTALLLAAASCGRPVPGRRGPASMPVARHAMAARPGLLAGGPRGLSAISASFISASAGWLLAVPPCAGYVRPCQTLLLRKTTDGGRAGVAVPPPAAPEQGRPAVAAPPGRGHARAAPGPGARAGPLAAAAQPVPQRVVDGGGSSTRRLAVPGLRLRARRGPAIQARLRLG